MLEVLFDGAAGEVTGSMHIVQWGGRMVALDCGLFQGRRAESETKNRSWQIRPRDLDAVIVSHAHIDHTGRLPRLVRDGFRGAIFCTPSTRDLSAIMLPDSAHIQAEDVEYLNKRRARIGQPPIEPLYEYADALQAIRQMRTVSYDQEFEVVDGLRATYREAGHMLGSAGIFCRFDGGDARGRTLYFTGDVGRPHTPILRDPAPVPPADIVLCESTYGGRIHPTVEDAREQFAAVLERTIARKGKVIIPAFSVGRTQTLVYYLHGLFAEGRLPVVPVYIDSPLSVSATEVFRLHPDCYDREARAMQARNGDVMGCQRCYFIRDVEESKALHRQSGPLVIISASGMCESGRIRHHIKNNINDSRNTILIPGFQAEHTLGRRLVEGAKTITLFHEQYAVRAEVATINGFSGHADQAELLRLLAPVVDRSERIILVHGEATQRDALAEKLRGLGARVELPVRGERIAC